VAAGPNALRGSGPKQIKTRTLEVVRSHGGLGLRRDVRYSVKTRTSDIRDESRLAPRSDCMLVSQPVRFQSTPPTVTTTHSFV
jgi:hypothetical protein